MSPSKPDLKSPSYEGSVSSRSSRLSRAVGIASLLGIAGINAACSKAITEPEGGPDAQVVYVQPDTAQGSDTPAPAKPDTAQEEPIRPKKSLKLLMFRRILRRLKKMMIKIRFRTAKIYALKPLISRTQTEDLMILMEMALETCAIMLRLKLIHYRKTKTEMV